VCQPARAPISSPEPADSTVKGPSTFGKDDEHVAAFLQEFFALLQPLPAGRIAIEEHHVCDDRGKRKAEGIRIEVVAGGKRGKWYGDFEAATWRATLQCPCGSHDSRPSRMIGLLADYLDQ
jgi:hypothetical protein